MKQPNFGKGYEDNQLGRGISAGIEPVPMNRTGILEKASNLVTGDRANAYGDFGEQMLSLSRAYNGITGQAISPEDAATFLLILKTRRLYTAKDQDSSVDLCGYAALYGEYFKG